MTAFASECCYRDFINVPACPSQRKTLFFGSHQYLPSTVFFTRDILRWALGVNLNHWVGDHWSHRVVWWCELFWNEQLTHRQETRDHSRYIQSHTAHQLTYTWWLVAQHHRLQRCHVNVEHSLSWSRINFQSLVRHNLYQPRVITWYASAAYIPHLEKHRLPDVWRHIPSVGTVHSTSCYTKVVHWANCHHRLSQNWQGHTAEKQYQTPTEGHKQVALSWSHWG